MIKRSPRTINEDRLSELRDQGWDSDLLLARLALMKSEGMRKTMATMRKVPRIYPEVLPTQASGRWSTKKPALIAFPREFWKKHSHVIYPDPGWWWLDWDWSGIESRMFTAYSGDQEDIDLFRLGPDIHTFTCSKYLMAWAPGALAGCQTGDLSLPSDWIGSKDERRTRAKNFRYGVLQYGSLKAGEKTVLGLPGIDKLGIERSQLLIRARKFLDARPKTLAWKQATADGCTRDKMSRTFMGRRRFLFGDSETRAKEGLAHKISGSVADLMDWCLIAITTRWPDSYVVLNKHDGAIVAFPKTLARNVVEPAVRQIVEREWEVGQGVRMTFPATWEIIEGA